VRFYFALYLFPGLFAIWVFYRWIIKEDLSKHMDEFRTGLFCIGFMLLFYWLVFA
jgi:hypothetical protein